jgi:DNA-binding transcriptional ArsR family regulator
VAKGGANSARQRKSGPHAAAPAPARLAPMAGELPGGGAMALDRLIHERLRLGIVSILAAHDTLTFNELKQLLKTTDGNLSVHARKLEEAGYVTCTKSFEGRVPRTEYRLSAAGRKALERYLNHMEALIEATRVR